MDHDVQGPLPDVRPRDIDMPPRYAITVSFRGGLSSGQKAAFKAAAARWEGVISAPLPAVKVGGVVTTGCLIDAQGSAIDGPSGILGMAGPTRLRPEIPSMGKAAYLPCQGMMSFDSADLAKMESDGTLLDVITHELGHVIGIGTVWRRKGVLVGAGTANPYFHGPRCRTAFHDLGGMGNEVPVENTGGGGTRDSHWRERFFRTELMTGWVSPAGTPSPLSRLTIASLEDLGYTVDYSKAEPYSLKPALLATDEVLVERPHCLSIVPFAF
jgi:hypothetical protein